MICDFFNVERVGGGMLFVGDDGPNNKYIVF